MIELKDKKSKLHFFQYIFCGVCIGSGAILPGISGGILAVIFGVYEPLMEALTHPKKGIKKHQDMFIPLALGWAIGFLGFAKGISIALQYHRTITIYFFIGLICGTLPTLFKEVKLRKIGFKGFMIILISAILITFSLIYITFISKIKLEPSIITYTFCGVLWGLSVVIPGLATSSILMSLGLYQPLMENVSNMQWGVFLTTLPAMGLTIVLMARLITYLLKHFHSHMFSIIIGFVLISTIMIIPFDFDSISEMMISMIVAYVGYRVANIMAKIESKD